MTEMTDDEVFGSAKPASELSDDDVFGTKPTQSTESGNFLSQFVQDYSQMFPYGPTGESTQGIVRRFARDIPETAIASPLRGAAGVISGGDQRAFERQKLERGIELAQQGVEPAVAQERAIQETPQPQVGVPSEHPLFRAGQAVTDVLNRELPSKRGTGAQGVAEDIAGGLASVAGNVGLASIPFVGPLVAGAAIPFQGAGEAIDDAIRAGATPEQQVRAAQLGIGPGLLEYADIALPFLPKGALSRVVPRLPAFAQRVLAGAFIEGGTEGVQQFLQNLIAQTGYDPNRPLSDDVLYNALIGGIVGGGVAGVAGRARDIPSPSPAVTDELLTSFGGAAVESVQAQPFAPRPPVERVEPVLRELENVIGRREMDQVLVDQGLEPINGTEGLSPRTEMPWYRPRPQATQMDPEVVAEIAKYQEAYESNRASPVNAPDVPLGEAQPMREEISAEPGVDIARLAKLLGPKLYGSPKEIGAVSVKEMLQNSFDAVKGRLEQGSGVLGAFWKKSQPFEGKIDIATDPQSRTISVTDNGLGMTPDVLAGPFLTIAGTKKETSRASGGLGIAKMLFLYGNQGIRVTTMRNGKVAELRTTGPDLMSALGAGKKPTISVHAPTRQDEALFPLGHGTKVELTIPETYPDPETGELQGIPFPDRFDLEVLNKSPLFAPIEVTFNNAPVSMGKRFRADKFTRFADAKFDWGTARIYITKEPPDFVPYDNVHVLSNGIWQFDESLTKDGSGYGERVPVVVYIDVSSDVQPEDQGYPFDLNRQRFSSGAEPGFAQILRYLTVQAQEAGLQQEAENFGSVEYLAADGSVQTLSLKPTAPEKVEGALREGDKIEIVDGQLVVRGKKIPILTPETLREAKVNVDNLSVPQDQIDPNTVMLHDNMQLTLSSLETKSMTELMRERFPVRFDAYMQELGAAFHFFRDKMTDLVEIAGRLGYYEGVEKGGIGISFDNTYHGVSIRVPFVGIFINPALPKFKETPELAAVSMAMTMLHEYTHHSIRTEDNPHKREMEQLLVLMDVNPGVFEWSKFKQQLSRLVRDNWDIQTAMQEALSGAVDVKPRSRSLKGVGDEFTGNAGGARDLARAGAAGESLAGVSQGTGAGESAGAAKPRSANVSAELGTGGSPDPYAENRAAFQRAGTPNVPATPVSKATKLARQRIARSAKGAPLPPHVNASAAHADHILWGLKYFAGLQQLAFINPRHAPLIHYYELEQQLKEIETRVIDPGVKIAKDWHGLGTQGDALAKLVDDLVNMNYLSPAERQRGTVRQPTAAELDAMAAKAKVGDEAKAVLTQANRLIRVFQENVAQVAIERAQGDLQKIAEIKNDLVALQQRPYFPIMHFGNHYVVVRDASGAIIHAETVEGFAPIARKRQESRRRALEAVKRPGETVSVGVLRQESKPLIGMPPQLLKMIFDTKAVKVTPEEINDAPVLRALSAQGLRPYLESRFQKRYYVPNYGNVTPGYSADFLRSFSSYMFHGAKYLAKIKMIPQMEATVAEAEGLSGAKNGYVGHYMRDHLENTIKDARGQFGFAKGFIFLWALGYSPVAALQNATQVLLSHSWLAGKFGDIAGTKALLGAIASQKTYYTRDRFTNARTQKGKPGVPPATFHDLAMAEAILAGRITESQAAELAGMTQADNLLGGIGGRARRNFNKLIDKSAWMFEMIEQWNRRAMFTAALDLAMRFPTAKGVREAERLFADRIQRLQTERGFTEQEAKAIATAMHAVDQTQFVYERGVRPRFMRNRWAATVLVFKTYIQSLSFVLATNKSDVMWRYLIWSMALGGLAGFPYWEEIKNLIKLATFGRVNLDTEVRRWITSVTDPESDLDETVLHGFARKGFGVAALLDTLGSLYTGRPGRSVVQVPDVDPRTREATGFARNVPFPVFDLSSMFGTGQTLPIDPSAFVTQDVDKAIAQQGQRASGAVFSVGFNLYRFLADEQYGFADPKRWERIFPRVLRGASQAFRGLNEGRERVKGGPMGGTTVVSFDPRDPMAQAEVYGELLGMAAGFQPARKTMKWERILVEIEQERYFDTQNKMLYDQMWEAVRGGRKEEVAAVTQAIKDYNASLPDWAKGRTITSDMVQQSMRSRFQTLEKREAGVPLKRGNIGIQQEIERLYGTKAIDVRPVR